MLILTVLQGPDKGRRYELPDHEPQLIGRSSEALPISDSTVSRRHAELTPDDGVWYVRDLDSQNGTYVNGVKISQRVRLRSGDQVRAGATLFVFGVTESRDPEIVRLMPPDQIATTVERTLGPARLFESNPNEESMMLAEPEPRAAAVDHLRVIYQLTSLTAQLTDKQDLLKAVMELVFSEFKPERGFIVLTDAHAGESMRGHTAVSASKGSPAGTRGAQAPQSGSGPIPAILSDEAMTRPAVVKYRHQPRDSADARIHISRTILLAAVKQGEGILSTNAMADPRFAAGDSVREMQVRSAICSPIKFRGTVFGVIYIDSTQANYTFTPGQLALMNAVGQHTGLALANADLYAEKLRSERLAAIGETVASLSHSIKNILQGLRGGADVVEMGLRKDDLKIARGGWPIMKRNLDRILGLTMNMLAFGRQRRAELELALLPPLIEDSLELLRPQAQTRKIALVSELDPNMPPIPIDAGLIHQAIVNLIGNAVEAVEPERGIVTVRAEFHPGVGTGTPYAEVTIIDNGPGIPLDKRQWIFEPFNTTKGLRGTGLGLAVAKRVVEDHGGTLTVESDQGRSATFRMRLPADAGRVVDPSATTG